MTNNSEKKKSKPIFLVLRIAVAAGALIWVFRGQDWAQLGKAFAEMNPFFFLGSLGIFIFSQFIVAFRWWLLLRAQSIHIPFGATLRLYYLGFFYNNCMPGSLGGDMVRAWYVTKHTPKKLEAALSVFVDRIIGLMGMVIIAVFCYSIFMRGKGVITSEKQQSLFSDIAEYRHIFLWLILAVIIVPCGLVLHNKGRQLLTKAFSFVYVHSLKVILKLKEAAAAYCRSPWTVVAVITLTIFLQSLVITSFWLLGVNLQIEAGARYYFVFFPLTWVIGALPVSIAGLGIVEGGLRELFTRFAGVRVEQAVALALCYRAIFTLVSLPGAVIHLLGGHLPTKDEMKM